MQYLSHLDSSALSADFKGFVNRLGNALDAPLTKLDASSTLNVWRSFHLHVYTLVPLSMHKEHDWSIGPKRLVSPRLVLLRPYCSCVGRRTCYLSNVVLDSFVKHEGGADVIMLSLAIKRMLIVSIL